MKMLFAALALMAATTTDAPAHAQTVNESTVFGVLMMGPARNEQRLLNAEPCLPPGMPRARGFRLCSETQLRSYQEQLARAVRERLGDPGRH
jgi:hypothetical protein